MSKSWILRRLKKSVGGPAAAQVIVDAGYTRHVLFFSIPQAVAHAEALVMLSTGQTVHTEMHAAHQTTREWEGNQIAQVVNDRAGITDKSSRRSH